jgi:hypothetical protein
MVHNRTVGDLDGNKAPRWMSAHASRLKKHCPRPACRWQWSDVNLDHGTLVKLRDMGLIVQAGDQEWRSTERLMKAIADYGRFNEDDVGTVTGTVDLSE